MDQLLDPTAIRGLGLGLGAQCARPLVVAFAVNFITRGTIEILKSRSARAFLAGKEFRHVRGN